MAHRQAVPVSPTFEVIARGAGSATGLRSWCGASPDRIFKALREVTLRDMKLAWLLGELRYLPSRLAGHMPPGDSGGPSW